MKRQLSKSNTPRDPPPKARKSTIGTPKPTKTKLVKCCCCCKFTSDTATESAPFVCGTPNPSTHSPTFRGYVKLGKKCAKPPFRRVLDEYVFKGRSRTRDPGHSEDLATMKKLESIGTNANVVIARHHIKPEFFMASVSSNPQDGVLNMSAMKDHFQDTHAGSGSGITGVTRSREELAELYTQSYSSPNCRTSSTSKKTGKASLGTSSTSPGLVRGVHSLRLGPKDTNICTQLASRFEVDASSEPTETPGVEDKEEGCMEVQTDEDKDAIIASLRQQVKTLEVRHIVASPLLLAQDKRWKEACSRLITPFHSAEELTAFYNLLNAGRLVDFMNTVRGSDKFDSDEDDDPCDDYTESDEDPEWNDEPTAAGDEQAGDATCDMGSEITSPLLLFLLMFILI